MPDESDLILAFPTSAEEDSSPPGDGGDMDESPLSVSLYTDRVTIQDLVPTAGATMGMKYRPVSRAGGTAACRVEARQTSNSPRTVDVFGSVGMEVRYRVFFPNNPSLNENCQLIWNGAVMRVEGVIPEVGPAGPPSVEWIASCRLITSRRDTTA